MQYLDVQGKSIELYFKSKSSYTSKIGGFLTLILLIIFIAVFIIFGQDFFYKLNPSVLVQQINSKSYELFKVNNKNFPLAFRLRDFRGNLVDEEQEHFYYTFLLSENKKNDEGQLKLAKNTLIGYSICKEEDFDPQLYAEKNLKDYFCINLSSVNATNLDFGGGWDGDYVNYLFAGITACKENSFNFQKGKPCGSDEKRKQIITKGIVSTILVPYVLFDPSNFEKPFIMDMKFISFGIDEYLIKKLELKFQNKIIESDIGWIFQQIEANQMLSYMSHLVDSIYYLSMKDNSFGSAMSTITFNMDKQVVKYYRKYMKIQELLANVEEY